MMHCEAISSLCSFQDYKGLWITVCKSIYKLCLLQDWGFEGLWMTVWNQIGMEALERGNMDLGVM